MSSLGSPCQPIVGWGQSLGEPPRPKIAQRDRPEPRIAGSRLPMKHDAANDLAAIQHNVLSTAADTAI